MVWSVFASFVYTLRWVPHTHTRTCSVCQYNFARRDTQVAVGTPIHTLARARPLALTRAHLHAHTRTRTPTLALAMEEPQIALPYRVLPEWPCYRIYCDGRIMCTRYNGLRAVTVTPNGRVRLKWSNRRQSMFIALLVAQAFLGPVLPEMCSVVWVDGDKLNNCVTNLQWSSADWPRRTGPRARAPVPPPVGNIIGIPAEQRVHMGRAESYSQQATFLTVDAAVADAVSRGFAHASTSGIEASIAGNRHMGTPAAYGFHWLRSALPSVAIQAAIEVAEQRTHERWSLVTGSLQELLVSTQGRVKRARDDKLVHSTDGFTKLRAGESGDVRLSYRDDECGAIKKPCLATLVARAFHPNADTLSDTSRVEHIDGDKSNNSIQNLRYV